MLKKINIGTRLWIGFILILFLFTFVSLYIVSQMGSLSNLTNMMYRHPLTVSNAVLRIDGNIVRIHRSMKDVALSKSDAEIHEAVQLVNKYEEDIYKDFELVSERFLGEKNMYENARKAFSKWKFIRDEVVELMHQGKKDEAATITKGKGAIHVNKLNAAMLALNEFAQNKARTFLDESLNTRAETLSVAYSMVIATIAAGVIFVTLVAWSISRPLSALMNAVLEISMGNLDKNIPVGSDDEIGQIGKAFNSMADKLKKSYAELEEKVRIRTRELAEANRELKKEISEHMRTEEELRLHAQALDNMLEGVNIVKADNGVFIYTNPALDNMFGYEKGLTT
ncbi:MAG: HAMP domain-containing protein [Desulfobacteraceae bacterium]|nr:HAMP domain-containing protein [Desulfobacteraceae bacterium]